MALPDYKRVRLNDTGAKVTVAVVREGMTELKQPATDRAGRPLPDEPAAPTKTAARRRTARTTRKTAASSEPASTTRGDSAADVS